MSASHFLTSFVPVTSTPWLLFLEVPAMGMSVSTIHYVRTVLLCVSLSVTPGTLHWWPRYGVSVAPQGCIKGCIIHWIRQTPIVVLAPELVLSIMPTRLSYPLVRTVLAGVLLGHEYRPLVGGGGGRLLWVGVCQDLGAEHCSGGSGFGQGLVYLEGVGSGPLSSDSQV